MPFDNTYAKLPGRFFHRVNPSGFENPQLIRVNREMAEYMDFSLPESEAEMAELFSGNTLPEGSEPIAQVYAGHQFGHFVPRLGDGRAVLLGEFVNKKGQRFDIQLKGSGQTRFSRNGDGRSPLGPVIREYIISEAMFRLGIPTTRSLAMVSTGEKVFREGELPGAVLTRIASSHIRVGTFEYFAARNDSEAIKILADYTIERHYPQLKQTGNPYLGLLREVCSVQAELVAKWMRIGFIHGVMNTDNTTVSGETIDYGPCAFMDSYDPATVFSSIDHYGRYAYGRQPSIIQWNMAGFAGCLLPLLHDDEEKAKETAENEIEKFSGNFKENYFLEMGRKIGINQADQSGIALLNNLLDMMNKEKTDFTLAFRNLGKVMEGKQEAFISLFSDGDKAEAWIADWKKLLNNKNIPHTEALKIMNQANPAYIPRNHQVEKAISAAVENSDFSIAERLLDVLKHPYKERPEFLEYTSPPEATEKVYQTFCGT